jgi:hypothetical protein
MRYFNEELEGGKWNHFMDQPKIGYISWRDPPEDSLQAITLAELELPEQAGLGVAIEGDRRAWPQPGAIPELPLIDAFNRQQRSIDIFNTGSEPFEVAIDATEPWIRFLNDQDKALSATGGFIDDQWTLRVALDWERVPDGDSSGMIRITGAGTAVDVIVNAFRPAPGRDAIAGFVEADGIVSIEAEHYSAASEVAGSRWTRIEDYGHTLSGMRAEGPVDVAGLTPGIDAPALEYRMHRFTSGPAEVRLTVAPTLNFVPDRALRVAVSFDAGPAQVLTLISQGYDAANGNRDWEESVRNNFRVVTGNFDLAEAGAHTLKVWMVDPAVIVQKIVVRDGDTVLPYSYLGPPESYRQP